jgi:hypothetical protein
MIKKLSTVRFLQPEASNSNNLKSKSNSVNKNLKAEEYLSRRMSLSQ